MAQANAAEGTSEATYRRGMPRDEQGGLRRSASMRLRAGRRLQLSARWRAGRGRHVMAQAGTTRWRVPLADVAMSDGDIEAVASVYRSGWLTQGPLVRA